MDLIARSPFVELFRRGEAPREVRLLAARGEIAPRPEEQVAMLVCLAGDADPEVAAAAEQTLATLPEAAVATVLAGHDLSDALRAELAARGPSAADDVSVLEFELEGLLDDGAEDVEATSDAAGDGPVRRRPLSSLSVVERMKVAMRGTREQRAALIRDTNKIVSTAVLSSPKLNESEVETFARMANVAEDVLRIIGSNRTWTRNYAVITALARNPKTPPAISMPLVGRLNERDLKMLSIDRNVPEGLRIAARKLVVANQSRRK